MDSIKMNIAKSKNGNPIYLHSKMVTRHGLIAGATGTGKTITLKTIVEHFSNMGTPTFVIDVKGDLNGFGTKGETFTQLDEFIERHQLLMPEFATFPVKYWDVYGEKGLPVRTTISDMGPILISKLLGLNENQTSIMLSLFKIADDQGLLLLDFKDLTEMVRHLYDNNLDFKEEYGLLNKQSIAAIQRALTALSQQEIDRFFGEKALEIDDLLDVKDGKGIINVMDASKMIANEKLYSTFLLWLLSEVFEQFEEAGDLNIPRFALFFDEAHLIFKDISDVLLNKIEQVIKLIRSKGVGIYFITQSAADLPDSILNQLGNRIQHGLRAYTPKELKNLRQTAMTFRQNSDIDIATRLLELGVGEVIISLLDESGVPMVADHAVVMTSKSKMGKVDDCDYFTDAALNKKYVEALDRESAYEVLIKSKRILKDVSETIPKTAQKRPGRPKDTLMIKLAKSLFSAFGRSLGNSMARGLMGTLKKW